MKAMTFSFQMPSPSCCLLFALQVSIQYVDKKILLQRTKDSVEMYHFGIQIHVVEGFEKNSLELGIDF